MICGIGSVIARPSLLRLPAVRGEFLLPDLAIPTLSAPQFLAQLAHLGSPVLEFTLPGNKVSSYLAFAQDAGESLARMRLYEFIRILSFQRCPESNGGLARMVREWCCRVGWCSQWGDERSR